MIKMIDSKEREFKNRVLRNTFPGLDLEVDDNGKISDVEFPDDWTSADTQKVLCKLLSDFADRSYGVHLISEIHKKL